MRTTCLLPSGAALAALLASATIAAAAQDPAPAPPATALESIEQPAKEASTVDPAIQSVRDDIAQKTAAGKIDKAKPDWRTRLPQFPDTAFAAGKKYLWHVKTNHGEIAVRLMPEVAPKHSANFVYLTELGFFDGLGFHRVIPGFMAQGGCPQGTGRGSPGYRFAGELDPKVKHDRPGLLSMANAGPNTDGSQFFLTFVPTPWLDGKHTIFGEVTGGMETLQELEKRGSQGSGAPTEPLRIERAWIAVE